MRAVSWWDAAQRWAKRQDLLVDEVSPQADAFKDLDQEFYTGSENLSELLRKCVPS